VVIITGLFLTAKTQVAEFDRTSTDLREITSVLKLTDMSFSTDARYTRHPSQADLFSAFQDYPGSIEHFPSGAVVPPPDFSALGTRIATQGR
jgi:hypothetical protein